LSKEPSDAHAVHELDNWSVYCYCSAGLVTTAPSRGSRLQLHERHYPYLICWPFDWHRYSGPCSRPNVRYL